MCLIYYGMLINMSSLMQTSTTGCHGNTCVIHTWSGWPFYVPCRAVTGGQRIVVFFSPAWGLGIVNTQQVF